MEKIQILLGEGKDLLFVILIYTVKSYTKTQDSVVAQRPGILIKFPGFEFWLSHLQVAGSHETNSSKPPFLHLSFGDNSTYYHAVFCGLNEVSMHKWQLSPLSLADTY